MRGKEGEGDRVRGKEGEGDREGEGRRERETEGGVTEGKRGGLSLMSSTRTHRMPSSEVCGELPWSRALMYSCNKRDSRN